MKSTSEIKITIGNSPFYRGMGAAALASLVAAASSPEFVENIAHPFFIINGGNGPEIDRLIHELIDGGDSCYENIALCTAVRLKLALTMALAESIPLGVLTGICFVIAEKIKNLLARNH